MNRLVKLNSNKSEQTKHLLDGHPNSPNCETPARKLVYLSSDLSNAQMLCSPDPFSGEQKTFETFDENPVMNKPKVKRIVSAISQTNQFIGQNSGNYILKVKLSDLIILL